MAKFDGKQLIGLIGNIVIKKGRGKTTIAQTKAENVRQTPATVEAGSIFGKASKLGKTIRTDLNVLIQDHYDGTMINRFNTVNRELLSRCYSKDTKSFTFKQDSFERLQSFEFNASSPLARSLWVKPEVTLTGNQLQLNLPEIQISDQLRFPSNANTCEIKIAVAMLVLNPALHHTNQYRSIQVSKGQGIIPARQFSFEVPDGCLCVVGMSLYFTRKYEQMQTIINDKSFNPAAICGAIITPGTFVLPPPALTATGGRASEWSDIFGLDLPTPSKKPSSDQSGQS